MTYKIVSLKVGTLLNFEKSKFTFGFGFGEKIEAPCFIWVIEGDGGQPIIVDTGLSGPEWSRKHHCEIRQTSEETVANQLKIIGVKPEEVETVVITHLHWDHCYNTEVFPNAKFYVQKKELFYALDPLLAHTRAYEVKLGEGVPPWFNFFNQMEIIDGDYQLAPGLDIVLLPGHSPGLQGINVETATGRYLIGSDAFPLLENWEKGIPSGIYTNLEDCYQTLKKAKSIADYVLPGHDTKVLKEKVYG